MDKKKSGVRKMGTIEDRAQKIANECHLVESDIRLIAAELKAVAEETVNEDRKVAANGFEYEKAHAIEDAKRGAYEDAARHFQAQVRTYTGKQVAKALLALRDKKFIRAKAKEVLK